MMTPEQLNQQMYQNGIPASTRLLVLIALPEDEAWVISDGSECLVSWFSGCTRVATAA